MNIAQVKAIVHLVCAHLLKCEYFFFQLLTEGYQVLAFYIPEFVKERKPRYLEFAGFQEGD